MRKTHDEEFDPIVQNAWQKLEIPMEPAIPCATQVRIPTVKAPTQKVAASKEGRERPSTLSEGRPSLTKREGQLEELESRRCILHRGRDHSHEDHIADRGFHSWHHYTPVPISKATNTLAAKMARRGRLEEILLQQFWVKLPSLECQNCHRQKRATLRTCICRRKQNFWPKSQLSSYAAHRSSVFGMHSTWIKNQEESSVQFARGK